MSMPDTSKKKDPPTRALEMTKAISEINTGASAFSSPADKAVAYARICDEIEAHRAAILQWKMHHNFISNVFRFPAELLAQIFNCVADSYRLDDPLNMTSVPWIHLSHVCSHWRRVALDTLTLWTFISSCNIVCASELLSRSQRAPLHFFVDYSWMNESQWKFVESMISDHMDRIEFLWLDCRFPDRTSENRLRHSAALLGKTAAPVLRTFVVKYGEDREGHMLHLPEIMFSGSAPCLQEVALRSGCDASWHSFPLNALTSLNIGIDPLGKSYIAGYTYAAPVAMADLMHLLDNLPNLKRLYFGMYILRPVPGQLQHKIHLDHLVDLVIRTDLANCAYLIEHLVCPTASTTNFCSFQGDISIEDARVIAGAIGEWTSLHVIDQLHLQWVSTMPHRAHYVHLQKAQASTSNGPADDGYMRIYLGRWPSDGEGDHKAIWAELLAPLRLPQLKVLQIDTAMVPHHGWLRSLGDLKSLREISSSCDRDKSLLRALTGAETTQFLALETLTCQWYRMGDIQEMLKDYLWKRQQLGRPLRVLSFAYCRGLDESKARAEFGGCVETVVWRP